MFHKIISNIDVLMASSMNRDEIDIELMRVGRSGRECVYCGDSTLMLFKQMFHKNIRQKLFSCDSCHSLHRPICNSYQHEQHGKRAAQNESEQMLGRERENK